VISAQNSRQEVMDAGAGDGLAVYCVRYYKARCVTRYDGAGANVRLSPAAAYAMLDGLFQQALLGHVAGRAEALDELNQQVHDLVPLMLVAAEGSPA
jgi:hypothetical protein